MKQLVVLFLCFVSFLAFTSAQTSASCAALSGSCAKCMMAGCQYVWAAPGFYNSSANATCLANAEFETRRFNNQYTKTIWAYALNETMINSTRGQYLLTKVGSSLNYFAQAVPCYDRQLCYCKPMPPPPPSKLIVYVRDASTGILINLADVNVNGTLSGKTGIPGNVLFDPIPPNSGYLSGACATGYICNSSVVTPPIGTNMTVNVTIYLTPLPCILTVRTVLDSDGSLLSGVTVTVTGFQDRVTSANGTYSYTLNSFPAAGSVNGFLSGYTTTPGSFSCGRGGNQTVVLRFIPLPNTVIVTVLDARTFDLITSALVRLTVTSYAETGVNAQATVTFTPVAAGNYVANGRATGYSSNSTVVPTLTTNMTIHVYIYLTQLPCILTVQVVTSQNNSLVIPNAAINLNVAGLASTSDANGRHTYTLPYNNATRASASKVGYGTNSTGFTCGKGENVTVVVYLPEVLQIVFSAVDAKTPGNPFIINATIFWDNFEVPADKGDPRYHYLEVPSLPLSGQVKAKAAGFNDQTDDNVRFTLTRRNYTISLAPQEFTLYFTPVELLGTATSYSSYLLDGSGYIANNYLDRNPSDIASTVAYKRNHLQVGGSATRLTSPVISNAYTANVTITFIDQSSVTVLAAKFDNVSPPPLDSFSIQPSDLSGMKSNWNPANVTNGNEVVISVPQFAATAERNLLIPYPYQINAGYLVVRVTGMTSALAAIAFGNNDFVAVTIVLGRTSSYLNYNQNTLPLGGKTKCIFEFPTAFGSKIDDIQVTAPLQTYNLSISNFADPNCVAAPCKPSSIKSGAQYLAWTSFSFTELSTTIFSQHATTKQWIRDPTKALYITRDYVLVQLPDSKKRSD